MRLRLTAAAAAIAIAVTAAPSLGQDTPAPEGAEVYFANLRDGDRITNPVPVLFGLRGMEVAPAGEERTHTGHHHLLINATLEGEGLREPIPTDDSHRHFGGGQTEVSLELPKGAHRLQLVLGDHFHVPHNPPVVSDIITITVE